MKAIWFPSVDLDESLMQEFCPRQKKDVTWFLLENIFKISGIWQYFWNFESERTFINYGFNKISYIETLRLDGYRFVVGGNFFAFDLPHYPLVCTSYLSRSSRFQKQHVNNRASISYMTNYYYMQKIRKRSLGKKILHPICSRYPVSSLNSSVATNSNWTVC